jgi:hypothetical protein
VERREYSRYFVGLEIEIKEVGSSFLLRGVTTNVSLGGRLLPADCSIKLRIKGSL